MEGFLRRETFPIFRTIVRLAPSEMHKPKNVTPIKLAKSWEQYEAVELLLQNGAEE
jgi:hypothetical protein